jgi:hypothetical protein
MCSAERAMVRMMCGVKLRDRKSSSELMSMVGLSEDILTLVRKSRLRWYGHARGHPFMTSTKFSTFLAPLPPVHSCPQQ